MGLPSIHLHPDPPPRVPHGGPGLHAGHKHILTHDLALSPPLARVSADITVIDGEAAPARAAALDNLALATHQGEDVRGALPGPDAICASPGVHGNVWDVEQKAGVHCCASDTQEDFRLSLKRWARRDFSHF